MRPIDIVFVSFLAVMFVAFICFCLALRKLMKQESPKREFILWGFFTLLGAVLTLLFFILQD